MSTALTLANQLRVSTPRLDEAENVEHDGDSSAGREKTVLCGGVWGGGGDVKRKAGEG